MDVRPGYKQSEVGVIPEDWTVVSLGDVTGKVGSGITPTGGQRVYLNQGRPFVRSQNVGWGSLLLDDIAFIGESTHSTFPDTEIRLDDVLLNITGASIGRSAIADSRLVGGNVNQHVCIVRAKTNALVPGFLNRFLLSACGQRQIDTFQAGGNRQGLNFAQVRSIRISLPRTEREQRAIATALSEVDALITNLDQLIAKKRDIKQAAMQQLLTGKTRLPGFNSTRAFVSDELGTRPRDWDVITLDDLVDPSRGIRYGIVQPGTYDPRGRFMIRGQDYSEAKGWAAPRSVFRVSDKVEQRYRSARVQQGDLIMTIVGYCGHVQIVPAWLNGANLTQTTARIAIRPEKASPVFCKYMLQSSVGKSQVASFLKGAAQPGLNCGDVEKFRIPLPMMREQVAIATVLSDMDAELAALEARRDKTRAIKQGMMQELLTGRIRLPVNPGPSESVA